MSITLIIPAAGSGVRLGAAVPKAFVVLDRRTLLEHAVDAAMAVGVFDRIVVAVPEGLAERTRELLHDRGRAPGSSAGPADIVVVPGGKERTDTVAAALAAALAAADGPAARDPRDEGEHGLGGRRERDIVMVHDAARPLTPAAVFQRVLTALIDGAVAVVPTLPVVDTIRRVEGGRLVGGLEREALRRVQTPQGFTREVLVRAHRDAAGAAVRVTDDAGLVEALGLDVHEVEGSELSMKITYPRDLEIARVLQREEARA